MVTKTYSPSNLCDSSDTCDSSESSDSSDSSGSCDSSDSSDNSVKKNLFHKITFFFHFFFLEKINLLKTQKLKL